MSAQQDIELGGVALLLPAASAVPEWSQRMELVIILLILAIAAAIFGFGGIASAITSIAIILFWVFLLAFIIGAVFRLLTGHWWYGHHHDD